MTTVIFDTPMHVGAEGEGRSFDPSLSQPLNVTAIYQCYHLHVARWAQHLAGSRHDLEDLVQDIFIAVQRKLPEFRGESSISTWLYAITIRTVLRRRKYLRIRSWIPFLSESDSFCWGAWDKSSGACQSAHEELEMRQQIELLYGFLDKLGEKYRTAIILFELEGLSAAQIAELVNCSVSAVWARLARGRRMLTKAFAKYEARNGF